MRLRQPSASVSIRKLAIAAEDGFVLGASLYHPVAARARGTVILHGATAVPQSYYRHFASFLAERGLRVLTYDYRGVGRSRPAQLRGFAATMTDWARLDAAAVHRFVRTHRRQPEEQDSQLGVRGPVEVADVVPVPGD